MKRIVGAFLAATLAVSACSKIPESETAKKIGSQPKQVIDKASADVTKSLQGGAEIRQDSEARQTEGK